MSQHESTQISYSDSKSLEARHELFEIFQQYPGTPEEAERNLGLFLRGSLMARIFAIREMYERIIDKPGCILDLGTWRGQTAVVCENLRAIFEPMHFNRRIAAFDTFEGYVGFSQKDKATSLHRDGTYKLPQEYEKLLEQILVLHEKGNAMGHNHSKHQVIKGDCRQTLKKFFVDHPNEFVALAFFDLNSFEPTEKAFEMVFQRMVPGGVMAFWQMTRKNIPAEGIFYVEKILNQFNHEIHRSKFYPGLCFIEKRGAHK